MRSAAAIVAFAVRGVRAQVVAHARDWRRRQRRRGRRRRRGRHPPIVIRVESLHLVGVLALWHAADFQSRRHSGVEVVTAAGIVATPPSNAAHKLRGAGPAAWSTHDPRAGAAVCTVATEHARAVFGAGAAVRAYVVEFMAASVGAARSRRHGHHHKRHHERQQKEPRP